MNIRKLGNYEIIYFDATDTRIGEIVTTTSLTKTEQIAKTRLYRDPSICSYVITKVVKNSKYNKWTP